MNRKSNEHVSPFLTLNTCPLSSWSLLKWNHLKAGWCPSRCCFDSPLYKRTWIHPGCTVPLRWTAACCTSHRWNSSGETLCSWLCGRDHWVKSPGRNLHTWSQISCSRRRSNSQNKNNNSSYIFGLMFSEFLMAVTTQQNYLTYETRSCY